VIVVSNTSPLNYLVPIDKVDVLPGLFGKVLVPESVLRELRNPAAPPSVGAWVANPPPWLEIRRPQQLEFAMQLGDGERDAVCLAIETKAERLLVDEKAAREVARGLGLLVTGTLGVLKLASARGLLDFRSTIENLRGTNFHISDELIEALLARYREGDPESSSGSWSASTRSWTAPSRSPRPAGEPPGRGRPPASFRSPRGPPEPGDA